MAESEVARARMADSSILSAAVLRFGDDIVTIRRRRAAALASVVRAPVVAGLLTEPLRADRRSPEHSETFGHDNGGVRRRAPNQAVRLLVSHTIYTTGGE